MVDGGAWSGDEKRRDLVCYINRRKTGVKTPMLLHSFSLSLHSNFINIISIEPMSETTSPVAKKARKSIDVCAPNDERVELAARMMLSNKTYSVPQAMLAQDFT